MGNRAVITTADKTIAVYLHWNGGRDSVEAFCAYCKLKEHRPLELDSYGFARLCQVIGNYFGGTTSVGISTYEQADTNNLDNGTYIIKNWEIVGRKFFKGLEQSHHNLKDLLLEINEAQPSKEQLGYDVINDYCRERGSLSDD